MAIIRKEEVIDSWLVLLGGSQRRAKEILGTQITSSPGPRLPI
jgi:hypothetical protein